MNELALSAFSKLTKFSKHINDILTQGSLSDKSSYISECNRIGMVSKERQLKIDFLNKEIKTLFNEENGILYYYIDNHDNLKMGLPKVVKGLEPYEYGSETRYPKAFRYKLSEYLDTIPSQILNQLPDNCADFLEVHETKQDPIIAIPIFTEQGKWLDFPKTHFLGIFRWEVEKCQTEKIKIY